MAEPHFFLGYLPFWIVTYTLAILAWTCVGRFLLQGFLPPDSPNYIWRAFRTLTDWAVAIARVMVPRYVGPFFLPLVAAFWLFTVRFVVGVAMLSAGWAPSIASSSSGG